MEEVFERKVREKEKKLNETEIELRQKLKDAEEKLEEQREDLEEKMAAFDKVCIKEFFMRNQVSMRCVLKSFI